MEEKQVKKPMESPSIRKHILKFIFYVLLWLFFAGLLTGSLIYSLIAKLIIKRKYKDAKLLHTHDALISYGESLDTSRFLAAFLCSGTIDINLFRSILLEKFVKPNPRLECSIEKEYGYFFFRKEEKFNIDEHVLYHPELSVSTKEEWKKVQTDLYFRPIPKRLAPWFCHFVPLNPDYEGKNGEPKFYMVLAIDHSIFDAYSGLRILLKAISDFEPPEPLVPSLQEKTFWENIYGNLKIAFFFSYMVVQNFSHKKKIFDSSEKSGELVYSESGKLTVETVKKIKNATNVTFKEVYISCIASALEKFFRRSTRAIPSEMILSLPKVLWKPEDKLTAINNFVPLSLHLPFNQKFCVDRLKEVNEILNNSNTRDSNAFVAFTMNSLLNVIPAFIGQRYYRGFEITTQLSVTGTDRLPEFILRKRKMENDVKRIIPVLTNTAFGFQINTLGNDIFISAFSRLKFITEEDLHIILKDIEEELEELKKNIL